MRVRATRGAGRRASWRRRRSASICRSMSGAQPSSSGSGRHFGDPRRLDGDLRGDRAAHRIAEGRAGSGPGMRGQRSGGGDPLPSRGATDGALSGYRWGVERKRALLEREAARMSTQRRRSVRRRSSEIRGGRGTRLGRPSASISTHGGVRRGASSPPSECRALAGLYHG